MGLTNSFKDFLKFFILTAWVLAGCGSVRNGDFADAVKADVIVEAVPLKVQMVEPGTVIDAVQGRPEDLRTTMAVVSFEIHKVLRGEFEPVPVGNPSKMKQAVEAAKKFNLLKILTLDFGSPDEVEEKKWLTIAVDSPFKTFGITSWETPAAKTYRLYLNAVSDRPNSYLLVDQVPLDKPASRSL